MADQYTTNTHTLYFQYQFLDRQLDVMCDQYDSWKVRQQRAVKQQHKVFQYVFQLRLVTLNAMMKNVKKLIDEKAEQLILAASLSDDMELLGELDIEIVD